jgi:predicted small metal-binding protein
MRTIECDVCGEPVTAESDEELAGRLAKHLQSEHDQTPDAEDVEATVQSESYEATDS